MIVTTLRCSCAAMSMLLIDDMSSSQGSDADGGAEPVAPSSPAPSAPFPLPAFPPSSPPAPRQHEGVCPKEAAALQDALDKEKKKQPALNRSTASGGRGVRAKAQPAPCLTADQAAAKAAAAANIRYGLRAKTKNDGVGAEVGKTQAATPKAKEKEKRKHQRRPPKPGQPGAQLGHFVVAECQMTQ